MTTGGDTALMRACRSNSVDLARLLLEHGADPNKRYAIAHVPADVGCQLVALLISQGARPTSYSLQIAALHGRFEALQLLLDAPSAVHISSEDSRNINESVDVFFNVNYIFKFRLVRCFTIY